MTAGHGSRKRSAVGPQSQSNRPITAKVPVIGRRNYQENNKEEQENDGLRPETVPFTNLGPLGETEPIDENDKIKQEITREVSGESDKEIEARIGNEEAKEESEGESRQPENKFNEPEKQMENLTDDASEKPEKEHHSDHSNKINVETDPKHTTPSPTAGCPARRCRRSALRWGAPPSGALFTLWAALMAAPTSSVLRGWTLAQTGEPAGKGPLRRGACLPCLACLPCQPCLRPEPADPPQTFPHPVINPPPRPPPQPTPGGRCCPAAWCHSAAGTLCRRRATRCT